MIAAVIVILVSVAAGAALAVVPGVHGRAIGAVRTFALLAAFGIVGFHLLPHALEGVGLGALVALVAGLLAPPALQRAVSEAYLRTRRTSPPCIGLEAGYVGLLAHQIGDGLALGVASARGPALLVAIASHTVPVVAVVVLAFAAEYGLAAALLRALGMALASLLGILAIALVHTPWIHAATPWVDAAVAGLLLHFVAHGLTQNLPCTAWQRALDLAAAFTGLAVSIMPGMVHGDVAHGAEHEGHLEVLDALIELASRLAPGLIAAVVVGVAFALFRRAPSRPEIGATRSAIAGIIQAFFDPASGWRTRPGRVSVPTSTTPDGVGAARRVAFWIAAPALGVETFVLTMIVLGPAFALARSLVIVVVALVIAVMAARLGGPPAAFATSHARDEEASHPGVLGRFEELLGRWGPWIVAGHLVAAYAASLAPALDPGVPGAGAIGALLAGLISVFACVPAAAAVPLVLVADAKGVGVLAPLVALVLLPVPWFAVARRMATDYGSRAAIASLTAGGVAVVVTTLLASRWLAIEPTITSFVINASGLPLAWTLLGGSLLVVGAWRRGVRGWIAAVVRPHEHQHGAAGHLAA